MWRLLLLISIISTLLAPSALAGFASFSSNSAVIVSANVWNETTPSIQIDSLTPGQQYRVYAAQSANVLAGDYIGNVLIKGADGKQFDVQSLAKPVPNTGYVLAETNVLTAPITIDDTTQPSENANRVPFVIYIVSTKIAASPVISALLASAHFDSSIARMSADSCTILNTAIRMELSELSITPIGELIVKSAGYDATSHDYTVLSVNENAVGSKLTVEGHIATLHNPLASPANFTFNLAFDAPPHAVLAPGASTVFLSQGWLSKHESYDSDYAPDAAPFTRSVDFGRPTHVRYRSVNNLPNATSCLLMCSNEAVGQQLLFSCETLNGIISSLGHPCTTVNVTIDQGLISEAPRFMVQIESVDLLDILTTTERPTANRKPDPYCNCAVDKSGEPEGWGFNDIWLDVVVIIDATAAMGVDDVANAEYLVDSLISDGVSDFLITDPTKTYSTRIGVIEMTDSARVLYNLNMTKADKIQGKITMKMGVEGINIIDAFDAAMNMFNGASTPDRTYTRQVIFYITDSNPTQDLTSLNEFKQKGVIIVNSAVHRTGLWNLASEGYYFIESSTKHVLRAFCKANCFCKSGKQAYGGSDPALTAAGGCYSSYSKGLSFSNAQTTCAILREASSKSDYFWIGFSKSDDGVWHWDDKSTDSYTNWNAGEPNSAAASKCAYADSTTSGLAWGAGNCNVAFPFVCEDVPCSVGYKNC